MLRFIIPIYGPSNRITPDYQVYDLTRYRHSAEKPMRIAMGENDQLSLGAGWANLHRAGHAGAWARRGSPDAFFYLPRAAGEDQFLDVAFLGCPVRPLSGELFANGVKAGTFSLGTSECRVARFRLRQEIPGEGIWECRIRTAEGWRPNDYFKNNDYRLLGPSVTAITLSGELAP
jgi:hypothetical protein